MKLIDLSSNVRAGMPKPPSAPAVTMDYIIKQSKEKEDQNGYSNKLEQFTITTHVATHFDAPSHFTCSGKNIDQYPIDDFFMIPTIVLDIPKGEYGEIEVTDIKKAEAKSGEITKGDLVIINTGFYRNYEDKVYEYTPFITEAAARYIADKEAKMVGIDSFTVDDPRQKQKPAHVLLLKERGILIIECIVNLDKILSPRFKSICFPINIKDGSGAFTRLVGVFED